MNEMKLTEKELIELTVKYGFNGSELTNKHFMEKGFLKDNGSYNSFKKKVDAICESWEKLRKKKGEPTYYIIRGLKEKASQTKDDRKFNGYNDSDYVMAKYVFNQLLKLKSNKVKSTYEWSIDCKAFNPAHINVEMIKQHFTDIYYDEDSHFVYEDFNDYIKGFNGGMIKKSFKWLEHENMIKVTSHYSGVNLHNKAMTIEKNTYDSFKKEEKAICDKYGANVYNYRKLRNNEKYADMFVEIDELYNSMSMTMVYVSYSVELLVDNYCFVVTDRDYYNAYYNQLIERMNKLQAKEYHKNTLHQWRVFNLLSTLSIIVKDNERLNQLIEKKQPESFAIDYVLYERQLSGMRVSDKYKQTYEMMNELDNLVSGVVETDTKIDVPEQNTKHVSEHNTLKDKTPQNWGEVPYSLDELLADVEIPNYTYIPLDTTYEETKETTYKDTIQNNSELANAVNMLRNVFPETVRGNQLFEVVSF